MTFTTELFWEGKTATGNRVPETYVELLGGGKRPPVVVTLNGKDSYRSTVAAEHREAARLIAGQQVEVTWELGTQPRTVEVPGASRSSSPL